MLRYWLPHSPMYLLNLAQLSGTNAPSTGVPTPPQWSKNVPMCLRNLHKNLVHGALIDAEILTSPIPHVFGQPGSDLGHWCSIHGCANTSSSGLKCSYVSQKPPKNLVHGALIDAEILTSPLPHVFAQLGPVFGHHSACRCANTSKVV